MRTLAMALVVASALPLAAQEPVVVDPDSEARAALKFLDGVADADRTWLRLMSTYAVPTSDRGEFERLLRFAFRQLTLQTNRRVFPARVPGSTTLWWFDLRSYGWNDAAWRAVALRDKTFREPWVDAAVARRLRGSVAERQPENLHVLALVDAWAWYRRTYQTVETPDYYDLLFAEQRFPLAKETETRPVLRNWPGGTYGGKDLAAGRWEFQEEFPKRGFVDFPATEDQWLEAFLGGVKSAEYETALRKLKARRGAVCKGSEDLRAGDPSASFVARNNRLVWLAPAISRINAIYGETFDQKESSGKRDVEENAFTDQDRDKGRVTRDGGELLFTLPAGDGLATLLVNGLGKRVEEVPPDIAIHTRDPRDRRVRNGAMACYACHAEFYGWIPLANQIERHTPDEVDVKFRDLKTDKPDRTAAEDFDAFFVGWQDDLKPVREAMKGAWGQATATRDEPNGLPGQKLGQVSLAWKWRYDDAVDLEAACRETGAPEPIFRLAAARSTLRKAVDLTRKASVPRSAWDKDVFPEVMKLLVSKKEKVTP